MLHEQKFFFLASKAIAFALSRVYGRSPCTGYLTNVINPTGGDRRHPLRDALSLPLPLPPSTLGLVLPPPAGHCGPVGCGRRPFCRRLAAPDSPSQPPAAAGSRGRQPPEHPQPAAAGNRGRQPPEHPTPAAAGNRGPQPPENPPPAAGRQVAAGWTAGVRSGRRGKKRGHSPRKRHTPAAVGPTAVTRDLAAAADNEAAAATARGGKRGKGVAESKTRTGKAHALSRHERHFRAVAPGCQLKHRRGGQEKTRAIQAQPRKERAQWSQETAKWACESAQEGIGTSSQDRVQKGVHTFAALTEDPARAGVPRVPLSPRGPDRECESVYGAARFPQQSIAHHWSVAGSHGTETRWSPPPLTPPTRHAGSVRSSAGASAGARQGRATMHGTAQPAYRAVPGRAPVWPGWGLRHPHAAKTSWPSARLTCCVTASR